MVLANLELFSKGQTGRSEGDVHQRESRAQRTSEIVDCSQEINRKMCWYLCWCDGGAAQLDVQGGLATRHLPYLFGVIPPSGINTRLPLRRFLGFGIL